MAPLINALTMGEPSGIGGELTIKVWHDYRHELEPFVAIDDPDRLRNLAGRLGTTIKVTEVDNADEAAEAFGTALPVIRLKNDVHAIPGQPSAVNAAAVLESIDHAVSLASSGSVGAVVTNPIQKETLYEAGFKFPGHTEYLADLAGDGRAPLMMLTSPLLRVFPLTTHMPIKKALESVNTETIVAHGLRILDALHVDLGIDNPILAIAGVNPHAGEGGKLGMEEIDIIGPAIEKLKSSGHDVFGPVPPDALFTKRARAGYDAALCMYHDQALIPIKALDFDRTVNVTLGLKIIRTSPDHGTALDIAGTGKANPSSLVASLKLASDLARARQNSNAK